MKAWQCIVCGYVYDESNGDPEHGIAPGTRWEDVPESWECPDCGGRESGFRDGRSHRGLTVCHTGRRAHPNGTGRCAAPAAI